MKYVTYESFLYSHNTSTYKTHTQLVNRVTVYVCPQKSLTERLLKHHGRNAKLNKHSGKLYVRQRVRKAVVRYANQERFCNPRFVESFVENYALNIHIHNDSEG